jgi:hypothetical protein
LLTRGRAHSAGFGLPAVAHSPILKPVRPRDDLRGQRSEDLSIVAVTTGTYGAEMAREPRGAIRVRVLSSCALGLLLLRRP